MLEALNTTYLVAGLIIHWVVLTREETAKIPMK
jgi:hypothetical protein